MNGRYSPLTMAKTLEELGPILVATEWEEISVEDLASEICDYDGVPGAQDFHILRLENRTTVVRYTRILRFVTVHEFEVFVQVVDEGIVDEDGDPTHKGWIRRTYQIKTDEEVEPA